MSNIQVKAERVTIIYPKINSERGFFYGQVKIEGDKASYKVQSWDRDVVNQIQDIMLSIEAKQEVNLLGTLKPSKQQIKTMEGKFAQAKDQNGTDIWTMAIDIKQVKLCNPKAKISQQEMDKALAPFGAPAPKKVIVEVKDDLQGITPNVEFDTPPSTSKKTDGIDYNDIPWEM